MTTLQNALSVVKTVRFDLREYILGIESCEVAAQMAQAVAFTLDAQIQSKLNGIVSTLNQIDQGFTMTRLHNHYMEPYKNQTKAMHMGEVAPNISELLHDLDNLVCTIADGNGFQRDAGKDSDDLQIMRQLIEAREAWHLDAMELTALTLNYHGNPRVYEIPEIEDFLSRPNKAEVPVRERQLLKMSIVRTANTYGWNNKQLEEEFSKTIEQREAKARQTAMNRDMEQSLKVQVFGACMKVPVVETLPAEFTDMSEGTQEAMIRAALRGAKRAEEFAASSRNITDMEFERIITDRIKVERELSAILGNDEYAAESKRKQEKARDAIRNRVTA